MLKQEDFSSYVSATIKDLVEGPYPYYILLGATQLSATQITSLQPVPHCSSWRAPARPEKQSYLFPSHDHRFQQGSCVADGGLRNVRMAVWEKTREH